MLTCLAFHVFLSEKTNATILEVGIGGTCDATNVISTPRATAITLVGFDHMNVLGTTLGEIASQKAGIMKPHVTCFTTTKQPAKALAAIQKGAASVNAPLVLVAPLSESVPIGIAGRHQLENAGIACALADFFFADSNGAPEAIAATRRGLSEVVWPGRCQTAVVDRNIRLYLDGAHTRESMDACVEWVCSLKTGDLALLFSITGGRDAAQLLRSLSAITFSRVLFADLGAEPGSLHAVQQASDAWHELCGASPALFPSVAEALDSLEPGTTCLVTGSLYLVGKVFDLKKIPIP